MNIIFAEIVCQESRYLLSTLWRFIESFYHQIPNLRPLKVTDLWRSPTSEGHRPFHRLLLVVVCLRHHQRHLLGEFAWLAGERPLAFRCLRQPPLRVLQRTEHDKVTISAICWASSCDWPASVLSRSVASDSRRFVSYSVQNTIKSPSAPSAGRVRVTGRRASSRVPSPPTATASCPTTYRTR